MNPPAPIGGHRRAWGATSNLGATSLGRAGVGVNAPTLGALIGAAVMRSYSESRAHKNHAGEGITGGPGKGGRGPKASGPSWWSNARGGERFRENAYPGERPVAALSTGSGAEKCLFKFPGFEIPFKLIGGGSTDSLKPKGDPCNRTALHC
jgi:hypothetical protein